MSVFVGLPVHRVSLLSTVPVAVSEQAMVTVAEACSDVGRRGTAEQNRMSIGRPPWLRAERLSCLKNPNKYTGDPSASQTTKPRNGLRANRID
jgi:hypothetical protein